MVIMPINIIYRNEYVYITLINPVVEIVIAASMYLYIYI